MRVMGEVVAGGGWGHYRQLRADGGGVMQREGGAGGDAGGDEGENREETKDGQRGQRNSKWSKRLPLWTVTAMIALTSHLYHFLAPQPPPLFLSLSLPQSATQR